MFKDKIETDLIKAAKELGFVKPVDTVVYISENPKFGDYSSNIPLQLSKQKHVQDYQTSSEIANAILEKLGHPGYLELVEVAGPGFLNFYIKDSKLTSLLDQSTSLCKRKAGLEERFLIEYGDPNTHKMLHIGHLVPLILGESICRLLEIQGKVFRVNYGSDIGLSVGKCLWGIQKNPEEYNKIKNESTLRQKAEFLGQVYAYAHKAYTEDPRVKQEIDDLTKKIYARDEAILDLWKETTEWSLAYFETIYSQLGIEFNARINESEVESLGKKIVTEHIGGVFVLDQGAIIFPGEKYGLHNRVFINSAGNPTYEAKDIGLTEKYFKMNHFDNIYSFAHREQNDYFRVVLKAIELVFGEEGKKRKHISFGELRLLSGKMSSREGNLIPAEDMIETVSKKLSEIAPKLPKQSIHQIGIGAIKFWLLKYSINSDIIFNIEKSVSLHGDSGPYVMYVYARINSILNRAKSSEAEGKNTQAQKSKIAQNLGPEERELLRQLEYFDFVVERAIKNLQPNLITSYLLEVTKAFNLFYERCPILISDKKELRLSLAKKTGEIIKLGLYLLGIDTAERM